VRILHLTDHYPPVLGGIETHVSALAERQSALGHDVTVLTSTAATADGRHSDDTGPVTVRRVRSLRGRELAAGPSYDVVHAHLSVVAPFSAPLAAKAASLGLPTVVTVHSLWSGLGPVPALAAELAGLRRANVLWTAVSRVAAEELSKRLPFGTQVGVLPNAVDVLPRRRTPLAGGGRVRLVTTMRVARRKRPLPLLRMFEQLRQMVDVPVDLVVVGDGPLRPGVERHVRRAGLRESVFVTGRVDPPEVFGLLSHSDLYVAPAVLESFGLAALEARSVGLPVVGHAGSGMTDFIRHGVEGLLCASDRQMVESLARLVVDTDLRRAMSEHNRTVRPMKTWAHALDAHEAAYAAVCARSTLDAGHVPAKER
jgi:glycosyltransferase involved in cell wall biosynthesis